MAFPLGELKLVLAALCGAIKFERHDRARAHKIALHRAQGFTRRNPFEQ
jgi:hypothetical protein